MHGAGNDFVLIPDLDDAVTLDESLTVALCDRHRGIGGDGVIRLGAARDGVDAEVFMDYRNADGSLAEMCGNGVRTVAKYAADRRGASFEGDRDVVRVDTRGGVKPVVCTRGPDGMVVTCRVDMGAPEVQDVELALDIAGTPIVATTLSMGNPHAVIVVDDVAAAPVEGVGTALQNHEAFPDGVNVEFIVGVDDATVHGRIFERGVGETLASGTGASAMGVAAAVRGLTGRSVDVNLPGGVLRVEWMQDSVFVTGPAVEVGGGHLDPRWFARNNDGNGGVA